MTKMKLLQCFECPYTDEPGMLDKDVQKYFEDFDKTSNFVMVSTNSIRSVLSEFMGDRFLELRVMK